MEDGSMEEAAPDPGAYILRIAVVRTLTLEWGAWGNPV